MQAGNGSPHAQEVAYVFQHLDTSKAETSKSDVTIAEAMGTYWTNFAKYGNPNGKGVLAWPDFSNANPRVMYFKQTPQVGEVPSIESLKVLDNYFKWRRSSEGEAWAK